MENNTEKLKGIEFSAAEDQFWIKRQSAPEVVVNGASLAVDQKVPLRFGDQIVIAGVECQWTITNALSATRDKPFSIKWLRSSFLDTGRNTQYVDRGKLTGRESPPQTPCPQISHLHLFPGKPNEIVVSLDEGHATGGEADSLWRVGSGSDCAIRIELPGVSRLHACIDYANDHWRVVDQLARNGVLVNGRKTLVSYLTYGDRIQFGPAECVVHVPQTRPTHAHRYWRAIVPAAIGILAAIATLIALLRFWS